MSGKKVPPYQVTDNPHALIHCGPIMKESKDDKRDLTIATSGGSGSVYYKDGTKVNQVEGASHELCGYSEQVGDKKDAPAKMIVARYGDIHIIAEMGDVLLKGKNIYIEATGESPYGNLHMLANGPMVVKSDQQLKLAGGAMCITAEKSLDINAQINLVGDLSKMKPLDLFSLATNFSWGGVVKSIANKCK